MSENNVNAGSTITDLVQNRSADGGVEIDDIASVSDSKSADRYAASDGVLLREEEGCMCNSRRQESDREKNEETSVLESTIRESGCKRKRDIEDIGGTCNRKSADELEREDWLDKDTGDHACWIRTSHDFRAKQRKYIRAKHSASELFCSMSDNIKYLSKDDSVCYHRWWLTTATQYDHVSLVSLILAADRKRSAHNIVRGFALHSEDQCHFGRPFYTAIERGHRSLVPAFLLAGESVIDSHDNTSASETDQYDDSEASETDPYDGSETAHQRPPRYDRHRVQDASRLERIHEHVSAVEYACIVNQPEVLKLLVTYFNGQHSQRNSTDVSSTSNPPTLVQNITRPLHLIMKLTTKFYGPHLNQLPALVQLIIDMGEDVVCMDERGYSPLQVLIDKVRFLAPLGEDGTAYRSTILVIAKILLKAGAKVNTVELDNTPLNLLAQLMFPYDHSAMRGFNASDVPFGHALRDHFNFVNDLGRLLLLNGADPTLYRFHEHIPEAAEMISRMFAKNMGRMCENGLADEVMDSLSALFQSALFAEANRQTDHAWNKFIDHSFFSSSIMAIADYSSHPGRSEKLIYMILIALSVRNLEKLVDELKSELRLARLEFCQERLNNAIKYVNVVLGVAAAPRSLQDLSRQAVIRAMSVRALLPHTSVDLGLPPKLKAFILL